MTVIIVTIINNFNFNYNNNNISSNSNNSNNNNNNSNKYQLIKLNNIISRLNNNSK